MAKTLKQLRGDIDNLRAELSRTAGAAPSLVECENALRHRLEHLAEPACEFLRACTAVIEGGSLQLNHAPQIQARTALGLGVLALGIDHIVELAKQNADPEIFRLSARERAERLLALRRRIYLLEIEEETLIESLGEPRRAGATPAAVLAIPLEIAEQHNLLPEV